MHKKNHKQFEAVIEIPKEAFTQEELFLLEFLNDFDREKTKEWQDKELWDFSY